VVSLENRLVKQKLREVIALSRLYAKQFMPFEILCNNTDNAEG